MEIEVEVEEGRGRIEYKVQVVEQLKRLSSKHRPNYLTFCTSLQDVSRFLSFSFPFSFSFSSLFGREEGKRGRMSLQSSWVDNTDIF